jgi:hypothetical protein
MTGSARCRAHHYHGQFAEQQARERLRAQRQQPQSGEATAGTAASDKVASSPSSPDTSSEEIGQKRGPEIDTGDAPE